MTIEQITEKQSRQLAKYDAAKKIRELIDAACAANPDEDECEVEEEILALVTDDE